MAWEALKRCCRPVPQRFVVATMVLLALSIQFINRLSLEMALRVITDEGFHVHGKRSTICPFNESGAYQTYPMMREEFYWTTTEQADLLGAFYIGYLIGHLPGGFLADCVGPKMVMGYGTLLSGICVYFTPLCARLTATPWVLRINRIVMGLAQGPMFPSMSSFIARWSVPAERNIMSAYMNLGICVGFICSMLVTETFLVYLEAWDMVFYLYGLVTVVFSVVWQLLAHDGPNNHPFITDEERDTINEGLQNEMSDSRTKVPIAQIVKSVPVWAMIVANLGTDCNFYALTILMPNYMDYVLYIDVTSNLLTSCGPYVIFSVFCVSSAVIAGVFLKKGWLSKTDQCKVWGLLGNIAPGIFILLGAFSDCNQIITVVCYGLAFGFVGFGAASIWVVNVDLSPNHAGLLMGLLNGCGSFFGILHPRLVTIFKDKETLRQWRIVLSINFVVVCFATLFFVIFGSSELQPWNELTRTPSPDEVPTPRTQNPSKVN